MPSVSLHSLALEEGVVEKLEAKLTSPNLSEVNESLACLILFCRPPEEGPFTTESRDFYRRLCQPGLWRTLEELSLNNDHLVMTSAQKLGAQIREVRRWLGWTI
jgi:hypothetical protein